MREGVHDVVDAELVRFVGEVDREKSFVGELPVVADIVVEVIMR